MSRHHLLSVLALLAVACSPLASLGQVSKQGLLSSEGARRAGLTRMWFTHLEMDSARGRMQGITHHVSSVQSHTEFEVTFRGRSYLFSERDIDAFGNAIGVDGAKEAAEKKIAGLTLLVTSAPAAGAVPPANAAPPANQAPAAGAPAAAAPKPEAPKLLMHVIPEITIYATSERGLVHAIDGETGKTKWASFVGDPRYPTSNCGASDDMVAVFNGSKVYVLKASDGSLNWEKAIPGAPVQGPAVTEDYVFVPLLNGKVEAYQVDYPRRAAATFRTMGRPTTQPIVLNHSVAWATDRGHVYVANANDAKVKYRVETKDNVVSTPGFLPPDKIFATSQDGYVYSLRESRGGIAWRFSTGESITHAPVGVRDTVYAIADSGTMYSIDAEAGTENWTTSGIRGFIAASTDRLYCTDITASLVVLDARSGSRVASISAPELEVRMMNTETDRIVVGTPSGLLQCFREIDQKWPEIRLMQDGGPRKAAPKKGEKKEEADKPKVPVDETKPAEDDPFAKPAAAGAAKPAEGAAPAEGTPPVEGADPFGGK
ncbi:MAG: PQQ-binding-like beta-propeller repeat protein [Pirellulaceae bacterium]|nr:PQQ-binding-like beta-propeller repeat protein [Pirellulaceae bacterium]